ncbi:CapA family protein, partial [Pseudomonas sp. AH2 (2023)]|uniref:CapA family protein n=1 Tax=Pseudomonas sp. AH2 (2023) TaxID=3048599 RepID=UPI002B22DE9E
MLGRSVNSRAVQTQNFTALFEKTGVVLKDADVAFINLEGPLVENCPVTTVGMVFCGDTRHIDGLLSTGIDIVTIANNHTGDHGTAGIITTTR